MATGSNMWPKRIFNGEFDAVFFVLNPLTSARAEVLLAFSLPVSRAVIVVASP